jgi:hypothetical protein
LTLHISRRVGFTVARIQESDLGDAWGVDQRLAFPAQYGIVAYTVGMNVITYAMSY